MANAYQTAYDQSINAPDKFWAEAAEKISWVKRWDKVLDDSNPPFTGGLRAGSSTLATMPSMYTSKMAVATRRR